MTMPVESFQKEMDYCAAVSIAKTLLALGLITTKEYKSINLVHIKKYKPDLKFVGELS